jgi:hypothetical protein
MLRTKIIAGLTAMLALGAVAGPAVAQIANETWHPKSGTLAFNGGGDQMLNIAFAFKGKRTPAQIAKTVKVTLSNATGARLVDATATSA